MNHDDIDMYCLKRYIYFEQSYKQIWYINKALRLSLLHRNGYWHAQNTKYFVYQFQDPVNWFWGTVNMFEQNAPFVGIVAVQANYICIPTKLTKLT